MIRKYPASRGTENLKEITKKQEIPCQIPHTSNTCSCVSKSQRVSVSQKTLDHTPLHLFFPSDAFKASTRARVADSCRTHLELERLALGACPLCAPWSVAGGEESTDHVESERPAPCPCVAPPSSCVLAGPKAASSSRKVYQRRHLVSK